jgi:hypothetical protein
MSKTQPKRAFLCAGASPRAPKQVFRDVRQDHAQSPTTVRQPLPGKSHGRVLAIEPANKEGLQNGR